MTTNNGSLLEHVKKTVQESMEAKIHFWDNYAESVIKAAELMAKTYQAGGRILIFGNGGSAADSQHMAAEMTGRMLIERKKPLSAIALTTDTSALTAIANDYSYEDIFDLQLKALGRKGDVAFAISTSGNSMNVVKAAESARAIGMGVIAMTGKTGGKLKALADISLNVDKGKNSSMIQETHITIIHLVVDLMDRFFLPSEYVQK